MSHVSNVHDAIIGWKYFDGTAITETGFRFKALKIVPGNVVPEPSFLHIPFGTLDRNTNNVSTPLLAEDLYEEISGAKELDQLIRVITSQRFNRPFFLWNFHQFLGVPKVFLAHYRKTFSIRIHHLGSFAKR